MGDKNIRSRFTLLIVESPTAATSISSFRIPGLEVLATGGYAWFPKIDFSTTKLKAKADPKKLAFRKELKEKAKWAVRVIIATDSDPSGAYIASCIKKHLKKESNVFFGRLNDLSKNGILRVMESCTAEPPVSDDLLRRYFLIRGMLQNRIREKTAGRFSLEGFLAGCVLKNSIPFQTWKSEDSGIVFESESPVSHVFGNPLIIKKNKKAFSGYHPLIPPFSTAGAISSPDTTYTEAQENLNRLFTTIPETPGFSLISYPRTSSVSYPADVIDRLNISFKNFDPDFYPLPTQLLNIREDEPHPAIHIQDASFSPHQIRVELRKSEFELYWNIYTRTREVLAVNPEPVIYTHQSENGIRFRALKDVSGAEISVKPVLTDAIFMQTLLDSGWIKPSSLGKTMDELIKNQVIRVEPGRYYSVKPGSFITGESEQTDLFPGISGFTDLYSKTMNTGIPEAKLISILDSLF